MPGAMCLKRRTAMIPVKQKQADAGGGSGIGTRSKVPNSQRAVLLPARLVSHICTAGVPSCYAQSHAELIAQSNSSPLADRTVRDCHTGFLVKDKTSFYN